MLDWYLVDFWICVKISTEMDFSKNMLFFKEIMIKTSKLRHWVKIANFFAKLENLFVENNFGKHSA